MGYTKTTSKAGNGVLPKPGNKITVHCTGIVADTGKKFWSTKDAGQEPFSFNVGKGQVIRGMQCTTMRLRVEVSSWELERTTDPLRWPADHRMHNVRSSPDRRTDGTGQAANRLTTSVHL